MGSGSSSSYSGTGGGSQPYAPSYHVERKMHAKDVERGIYHDGRYDKNPTAKKLTDTINGNYIKGKTFNDENLPYVVDMKGNIIFGKTAMDVMARPRRIQRLSVGRILRCKWRES